MKLRYLPPIRGCRGIGPALANTKPQLAGAGPCLAGPHAAPMKVLLTGATGFIGRAFGNLAARRGHEVVALVRPGSVSSSRHPLAPGVARIEGTLADPPWKAIRQFAPEVCVHAAWIATPGIYLNSPKNERYFAWSLALAKGLVQIGVRHLVVLGTCIEYEIGPEPLREGVSPIAPTTPYARWKNALRQALQVELSGSGTVLTWARLFYPYGPGEHPERLCTSLAKRLLAGERVTLKTPKSIKDYIYITDVASALLTLVDHRFEGPINIATGNGVAIEEIGQILGRLAGSGKIESAEPPVEDPCPVVVADSSLLRSLGWVPKISLETGLGSLLGLGKADMSIQLTPH